jgi:NADPH:quinone reductase-like Zn-dependent oxidoreductase
MRAVELERYGSAEVLRVGTRPEPAPTGDQVVVAVEVAGLNMADWHLMTGLPRVARLAFGLRAPHETGLGTDLVGTVVAVGPEVTALRVGDRVLGAAEAAFADRALSRERRLAVLPPQVPADLAAAVPMAGTTALQALRTGRVAAGSRLLVLGAGGGVGSLTVQLALRAGAEVTAATTPEKHDLLHALGVHAVVDRTRPEALGTGYDAVVVTGGLTPLRRLRALLAPRGTLVLVGGEGGGSLLGGGLRLQARAALLDPFVRQRLRTMLARENPRDLATLRDALADGTLTPVIDRRSPLEDVAAAITHLATGRARGKVVLTVS